MMNSIINGSFSHYELITNDSNGKHLVNRIK